MKSTQHRNITIDLLRGTAALCMILGHSFIVHPVDISAVPWCSALRNLIYSFHMELFFVLAGWVYKCVSYQDFIIKKAKRLLIPYFFFGSVSILLHSFGGSLVSGTSTISAGIFSLLFRGGGYWFLYTLFVISAIYPLLEFALHRPKYKMLGLIFILFLDCIFTFPNLFTLGAVVHYLPYFIFGNLIHTGGLLSKRDLHTRHCVKLLLFFLLLYIGASLIAASIPQFIEPAFSFVRSLSFCIALYSLFTMLQVKSHFIWKCAEQFLIDASRYSLQFYLFNGYLLVAARILICSILHIRTPLIIVLGIFCCNVLITLFVCKKIIPRVSFMRFLCGL